MKAKVLGNRKGRLEELMRKAQEDPVFKEVFEGKKSYFGSIALEQIVDYQFPIGNTKCISFGPNGELAVGTAENEIVVFGLDSILGLRTLFSKKPENFDIPIMGLSYNDNGMHIASFGDDNIIKLYRIEQYIDGINKKLEYKKFKEVANKKFKNKPACVSFSPNSWRLAVAYAGEEMQIFKVENDSLNLSNYYEICELVAFGPNGYFVDSFKDYITLHRLGSKGIKEIAHLNMDSLLEDITSLSFSPDEYIAVGGYDKNRGYVSFLEVDYEKKKLNKKNFELKKDNENISTNVLSFENKVNDVSFSPDKKYLAVCLDSNKIKIYMVKRNEN